MIYNKTLARAFARRIVRDVDERDVKFHAQRKKHDYPMSERAQKKVFGAWKASLKKLKLYVASHIKTGKRGQFKLVFVKWEWFPGLVHDEDKEPGICLGATMIGRSGRWSEMEFVRHTLIVFSMHALQRGVERVELKTFDDIRAEVGVREYMLLHDLSHGLMDVIQYDIMPKTQVTGVKADFATEHALLAGTWRGIRDHSSDDSHPPLVFEVRTILRPDQQPERWHTAREWQQRIESKGTPADRVYAAGEYWLETRPVLEDTERGEQLKLWREAAESRKQA